MAETVGDEGAAIEKLLRTAFWSFAVLLLLAPLVASHFTDEMQWTGGDFVFAGLLIGAVGLVFEAIMRLTRNWTYRFAAGLAIASAVLIVLANGAVGMIGNEDNPYNLTFLGVIALALAGAAIARFRPPGLVFAMAAAGVAQVALALGGLAADPRGAMFSAALGTLWLVSATLFRNGAREQASAGN